MSEKAAIQSGEGNDGVERRELQAQADRANETLRLEANQAGRGAERSAFKSDGGGINAVFDSMREKIASLPNDGNQYASQEHALQVMEEWSTFFAGGVDALMGRTKLTEAQVPHQQLMAEFALNLKNENPDSVNALFDKLNS